jgi:acyl carrier protein
MNGDYASIESMLSALWCETLRLPQVAATDNFIDLGGNSLAAMRIASRVKDACGIDVPISVILGDGTLREQATAVFALIHPADHSRLP